MKAPMTIDQPTLLDQPAESAQTEADPKPDQAVIVPSLNAVQAADPSQDVSLTGRLLNIIESSVHDPNVDVPKVRALLDMQNEVLDREAKRQFMAAFARMQPRLPMIPRNGIVELVDSNGKSKGSYDFAKFEDEWEALQPILAEFGFSVYWDTKTDEKGIEVIGTLCHEGGHSKESRMTLPPDTGPGRNPLQARGSTVSYGKRYVFENMLNLVRVGRDDDGVAAGKVYLTEEQIDQLTAELKAAGSEESTFLAVMTTNCHTFSEVEAADFTRLLNTLKARAAKRNAGKPDAGQEPQP